MIFRSMKSVIENNGKLEVVSINLSYELLSKLSPTLISPEAFTAIFFLSVGGEIFHLLYEISSIFTHVSRTTITAIQFLVSERRDFIKNEVE